MTFNVQLPGCVHCFETGGEAVPGDSLSLTLDEAKFPNLATNPVSALINSIANAQVYDPETNTIVGGHIYNVTVPDSQMPVVNGSVLQDIDICDVIAWECESCCTELDRRVTVLEALPDCCVTGFSRVTVGSDSYYRIVLSTGQIFDAPIPPDQVGNTSTLVDNGDCTYTHDDGTTQTVVDPIGCLDALDLDCGSLPVI